MVTKLPAVAAEEEPGTACTVEVGRPTAKAFVLLGAMLTNLVVVDVIVRDATCGFAGGIDVFTRRFTAVFRSEIVSGAETAGLAD